MYFIPASARPRQTLSDEAWAVATALSGPSALEGIDGLFDDKRILVIAHPGDAAATAFLQFAANTGADCVHAGRLKEVQLSASLDRCGNASVSLANENGPFTAVLNLSLPLDSDGTEEARFQAGETFAALWFALHYFPGPVINRPGGAGLHSDLTQFLFQRDSMALGDLMLTVSTQFPSYVGVGEMNVHLLRNGQHLGRQNDADSGAVLTDDEVYVFTRFDPSSTHQLLVAGNTIFDLASASGEVDSDLFTRACGILRRIQATGLNYCVHVLEDGGTEARLLRVYAPPRPMLFTNLNLGDRVHLALLRYLTT